MKYLFYLSILINFQYIAQTEKTKIADTLPGWFRFEKNVHAVSLMPVYAYARNPVHKDTVVKAHIPGFDLVYHYFPIKRLGIGANLNYTHAFYSPQNDINKLVTTIDLKYYFFGRHKYAFYLTGSYGLMRFSYVTNENYPWANFPDDAPNGQKSIHSFSYATLGAGAVANIFNNMTINFHTAPYFWLKSNPRVGTRYYHLGLYYYFNRKPTLPRKKANEIDWKLF